MSHMYGLFTGGLGAHTGAETIGATVVPVSTGNTKRQIQILRDFGCTAICCTPSYALYIAETLAKMGLGPDDISLKYGFFGAEPWTENMRQEIERALGIRAYDIFGLTEMIGPGVAFECDAHSGLHVNEDHFIPEIIDPDTCEPLPDGTPGELVFSSVSKEGMPLCVTAPAISARSRTRLVPVAVRSRAHVEACRTYRRYAHRPRRERIPVPD